MKKTFLSFICFLFVFSAFSQENVVKEKLATFGQDEFIVMEESCINFSMLNNNFRIITKKGRGDSRVFFVYERGKAKQGPIKELTENQISNCGSGDENNCSIFENEEISNLESYFKTGEDNKTYVLFNGKEYGPFDQIGKLIITKDKSKFYALVKNDERQYLLTTSNNLMPILGMSDNQMLVSPDGNLAIIRTTGTFARMQDIGSNFQDLENGFLYTSEGKKYGPYKASELSFENIWFTCYSNAWFFTMNNKLFRNAIMLKTIENGFDKRLFWIKPDGSKYAYMDNERFIFSDGTYSAFPIKIKVNIQGGIFNFQWISIENDNIVTFNKKTF